MKRGVKLFLFIFILAVLAAAIYFTFFFKYSCSDISCFNAHLEKCSKTKFLKDETDASWLYKIQGEEDGQCIVEVKLLQVKQGKLNLEKLEGKSMDCSINYGLVVAPESVIANCHGELKEGLQDLIIQNLHSYILSNLGEIDDELDKVI